MKKKTNVYESPQLQITEVKLEAVIAVSVKVNVDGEFVENWTENEVNNEFNW